MVVVVEFVVVLSIQLLRPPLYLDSTTDKLTEGAADGVLADVTLDSLSLVVMNWLVLDVLDLVCKPLSGCRPIVAWVDCELSLVPLLPPTMAGDSEPLCWPTLWIILLIEFSLYWLRWIDFTAGSFPVFALGAD